MMIFSRILEGNSLPVAVLSCGKELEKSEEASAFSTSTGFYLEIFV